jgi:hypothetical protein
MPLIWECRPESRFRSFDITLSIRSPHGFRRVYHQSKRQAQGRGRHPRARWARAHTRFQERTRLNKWPTAKAACTNGTEEFFSRMRRTEIGHHHHIAAVYLPRYASESAWRDNHRRMSNGEQFRSIVSLVAKKQAKRGFLRVLAAVEGGLGPRLKPSVRTS